MNMFLKQAYALGHGYAVKEASRWREAIRSGELSPEVAEELKARMGVTPEMWSEKLMNASKTMADRAGISFNVHNEETMKDAWRRLLRDKGGRMQALKELSGGALSASMGPITHPILGINMPNFKNPKFDRLAQMVGAHTPEEKKMLLSLAAGHEGHEGLLMSQKGQEYAKRMQERMATLFGGTVPTHIKPSPTDMMQGMAEKGMFDVIRNPESAARNASRYSGKEHFFNELLGGNVPKEQLALMRPGIVGKEMAGRHASPKPPLWDIRESRMFPQSFQEKWHNTRSRTGEIARAEAAGATIDPVRGIQLPRKALPKISKGMQAQAKTEMAHLFSQPPSGGWATAGNVIHGVRKGVGSLGSFAGRFMKALVR